MSFLIRRSASERVPGEPLRLVNEIAHAVTHVENEELPQTLSRILEAVRVVTGLQKGQIILLDHAFNEVYILEDGPQTATRSKVSEVVQAPDFHTSFSPAGEGGITLAPVCGKDDLLMEVSVSAGSRELGLLYILSRNRRLELSAEDRQILETLASLAAVAIDRRRRRRDSSRLREWLDALWGLFSANRIPRTQEDVDRLLQTIATKALRISDADFVVLYEYLEERGDFRSLPVLAGSVRDAAMLGNLDGGHQKSVISQFLQLKGIIFAERIPDQWIEAGLADADTAEERSPFRSEGVVSSVGVPLRIDEERIGVLFLNYRSEQNFNQEFREHLELFANHAALAVGNARLFLRSQTLNQELSALIHAGPYAVVAIDKKGRITEFNAEAAALFRYPETLRGGNVIQLYWGGIQEAHRIQALLERTGKIRDEETFGRTASGEKIPVSLTASLLRNDAGERTGSVGILQDLRLQSLRGRTQLLVRALREISDGENLERMVDLVVLHAVDLLYADAGALFLRVNETTFELRGTYGAENELLQILRLGDFRGRLAHVVADDLRGILTLVGDESPAELRLVHDSLSSVLVPIRTDDRLLGLLLIESRQRDHFSADQKLLEVLASQAAVSINRIQLLRFREETRRGMQVSANAVAVGQIATSFVHEAKNSLNGMSLTVHNLREDIDSEPDLKAKQDYTERLAMVLREMERLDDLYRRLQRFTKQGIEPEKRDVYLNEVVTSTLQLLESVLHRKEMRFEERLDSSLGRPTAGKGHPIEVDEGQVQQVLMNLILNAVAASPRRSRLLVETRNHPGQVEIRVTDYGSGISSEAKRNLFTPFFTTKREGVGLGLFISRLLVEENHSGSIEIVSTALNKGTTFSVRLPKRA